MYCSSDRRRELTQALSHRRCVNDGQPLSGGDAFDYESQTLPRPAPALLVPNAGIDSTAAFETFPRTALHAPTPADRVETGKYLECAAIALAARVLTAEQIAIASRTNEQLRDCSSSPSSETASFLAQSFHLYLLDACPNNYMVTLFHSQNFNHSAPRNNPLMSIGEITRAADDHDKILRLIQTKASSKSIERFLSGHLAESTGCCTIA